VATIGLTATAKYSSELVHYTQETLNETRQKKTTLDKSSASFLCAKACLPTRQG